VISPQVAEIAKKYDLLLTDDVAFGTVKGQLIVIGSAINNVHFITVTFLEKTPELKNILKNSPELRSKKLNRRFHIDKEDSLIASSDYIPTRGNIMEFPRIGKRL